MRRNIIICILFVIVAVHCKPRKLPIIIYEKPQDVPGFEHLTKEGTVKLSQVSRKLALKQNKEFFGLDVNFEGHISEGSTRGDFQTLYEQNEDGIGFKISYSTSKPTFQGSSRLDRLRVTGIPYNPKPVTVLLNNNRWSAGDWHYNGITKTLEGFDLDIPLGDDFTLQVKAGQDDEVVECPVSWNLRGSNGEISEENCLEGCVWDSTTSTCNLPPNNIYGYVLNYTDSNDTIRLSKVGPSLYGDDIADIQLEVIHYGDNVVRIKFSDPNDQRFEVPLELNLPEEEVTEDAQVVVVITASPFEISVERLHSGEILFNTAIGGLTFANQLLTFATRLPSENIYGFGEDTHLRFKRELDGTTWPLFTRDEIPPVDRVVNLYGVHPFYEVIENDGNTHGVLILNSNAMEYRLTEGPTLTYRTVGGILDLFFFLGPTPEDVVSQYSSLIGRPYLPPYWGLGFQLSRWGANNITKIQTMVNRTRSCGVPQDIQYVDSDYMIAQADFSLDEVNFGGLPEYANQSKEEGLRFVLIVDPGIPNRTTDYPPIQNGLAGDVFIRFPEDEGGEIMFGRVWPEENVAFPDFFKTSARDFWINEITNFQNVVPFSGLWIDMNEPSNFGTNEGTIPTDLVCSVNGYDNPPYVPRAAVVGTVGQLAEKTLCMVAQQGNEGEYRHYDVHSLYGWSESEPTMTGVREATGKRGMVLARSTYVGSGKWTTHWTGDVASTWEHLRQTIVAVMNFNLFGLPYVGADICGFFEDTTEELCQRWMELGAFYPFSRNHNSREAPDQDPCVWPDTVGASSRIAFGVRYRMLPYLYNLLFDAHTRGATVFRPVVHEFPTDRDVLDVDEQFMWGPAVMVSPVVYEGATSVEILLPEGVWYDYYTSEQLQPGLLNVSAPGDVIPVHLRGGYIIVVQEPAMNTMLSRQNPFGLIVAPDTDGSAIGNFFWDDGESIDTVENNEYQLANLTYQQGTLSMAVVNSYPSVLEGLNLESVEILGVDEPSQINVNGEPSDDFTYDPEVRKLTLNNLGLPMSEEFEINIQ